MPDRARKIEVVRRGHYPPRVLVDGQELPCEIDPGGVRVISAEGYQPGVTLTFPADTVHVTDSVEPEVPEEQQQRVQSYLQSKAPPSSWRPGR